MWRQEGQRIVMRRHRSLSIPRVPNNLSSEVSSKVASKVAPRASPVDVRLGFFALLALQILALAFVGLATGAHATPSPSSSTSLPQATNVDTAVHLAKAKKRKSFREVQRTHGRVKAARKNAQKKVEQAFAKAGLAYPPGHVFIRVIKDEDVVELWGANDAKTPMVLVQSFDVCARSGTLGPKRQQGDLQVPEGFYELSRFNPWSAYHLSLGVSYPNRSDRKKGKRPLGGDILIHGDCVTIGCIPIEDGPIEELYVALLDARLNGQRKIPLHIFPARLDDKGLKSLIERVEADDSRVPFWKNLQPGYALFDTQKVVPKIKVEKNGDYRAVTGAVPWSRGSSGR